MTLDHGSGEEITILVGAPSLGKGLPSSGRLLVVEADSERAQQLRRALQERPEALVCEEVLAIENEAIVPWHRFNDARLNGHRDLTLLQQRFPNLRGIDEEQRCGRCLADLLDHWVPRGREQAETQLHLVLRQGDPLAALAGLGPWLIQLQTVQLMLPWPEEALQLVTTWLGERNFGQVPHTEAMWERDPIATKDWLLLEKEKEKQSLLAANQQLNIHREELQAERDTLATILKETSEQFQELRKKQNQTLEKIAQSQNEAEELKREQEVLQQRCQLLTSENSELSKKLQAVEAMSINHREALEHIFPFQKYREENTDLEQLDEDSLLLHYLQHGRHEQRLKTYQKMDAELKSSLKRCKEAEPKLELLEAQFELARQQLENTKDLFARLTDNSQLLQQSTQE